MIDLKHLKKVKFDKQLSFPTSINNICEMESYAFANFEINNLIISFTVCGYDSQNSTFNDFSFEFSGNKDLAIFYTNEKFKILDEKCQINEEYKYLINALLKLREKEALEMVQLSKVDSDSLLLFSPFIKCLFENDMQQYLIDLIQRKEDIMGENRYLILDLEFLEKEIFDFFLSKRDQIFLLTRNEPHHFFSHENIVIVRRAISIFNRVLSVYGVLSGNDLHINH